MSYNKPYSEIKNLFGSQPEKILIDYADKIDKSKPVMDIGAGQGRNTYYLAKKGFSVDAIDPSSVAVETIKNIIQKNGYSINPSQCDFQNYNSTKTYSAILVFGLIQILKWESITSLIEKIEYWTSAGSIVFITAFSIKDSSYQKYSTEWKQAGKNSFSNKEGEFRTFLEENEILTLFQDFSVIHHWEGLGNKHKHGDGPIEQHSMIEAVLQKM